jgi:hypothetical protein
MATIIDGLGEIIETRPGYMVGAAQVTREIYLKTGVMIDKQTLILSDPTTGLKDFAGPETEEDRINKRLEKAKSDLQNTKIAKSKRAQKEAARKRRHRQKQGEHSDAPKSAKSGVVGQ